MLIEHDITFGRSTWALADSKTAFFYQDPWMTVRKDDVIRPDGLEGTYSTVRIKPGVCVIPLDRDGSIYLTKEFHYAVGRDTIEGISGGIEAGNLPRTRHCENCKKKLVSKRVDYAIWVGSIL